jgi:hypothetical protein
MTMRTRLIIGAILFLAVGAGILGVRQTSGFVADNRVLEQRQAALAKEIEDLNREIIQTKSQIASLRDENERLDQGTAELLKLRSEAGRLRGEPQERSTGGEAGDTNAITARILADRVNLLRQRFEQWPGKKTPELQLLSQQDWLNEAVKSELDTEDDRRRAMSHLRNKAKWKFADAIIPSIDQFAQSNNGQPPADISQLKPLLEPPIDSCLDAWEIAKPGWVTPPMPNSPDAERAKTWALVEKGSFSPDGIAAPDQNSLADPEYDAHQVIYQGGTYGYGPATR